MERVGRWARKYLPELILLSVLVGLVGSVVLVAQSQNYKGAMRGTTRLKLKSVEQALRQYNIDNDYPTQAQGLAVLNSPPGGERPYFKDWPKDAWNNDIMYYNPPLRGDGPFEVKSAGPDGQFGTDDDIYPDKKRRR